MQLLPQKHRRTKLLVYGITLLVAYSGLCVFLAHSYLHPVRLKAGVTPSWIKEVLVPGAKGDVPTWASPRLAAGKGNPVVFVLAYGYGGDRSNWSDVIHELSKRGFEAVAPSMPGQDASPDPTVGFGVKEAAMVLDTVKWVRKQYKNPPKIVLWGLSMGGAAVWLASEQDPTVDAVITEGAYSDFNTTMYRWLNRKMPGSSFYLRPMIWLAAYQAHINPSTIIPGNAAAKWRKPALVVQGADDNLILMSQAETLASGAHCPLWVVPGAKHAECYGVAKDEFLKKVTDIAKHL